MSLTGLEHASWYQFTVKVTDDRDGFFCKSDKIVITEIQKVPELILVNKLSTDQINVGTSENSRIIFEAKVEPNTLAGTIQFVDSETLQVKQEFITIGEKIILVDTSEPNTLPENTVFQLYAKFFPTYAFLDIFIK